MGRWRRISIVTPSLNHGRYIAETIDSVMSQGYPALEHIVVDGGSTDGTLETLARYPQLRVLSEKGRGYGDALNTGFRLATGEILGFLDSDRTLLPGALHCVAQEIDPARGRHVVMGRCRFVDAEGRFVGIEHARSFEGRRRVLEVWKGHSITQPVLFWTAEVWRTCGPMDDRLQPAWIDYDLFCRMLQCYPCHAIDALLASHRLHARSKIGSRTEGDRPEEGMRISRRYWGSPFRPLYWQLATSFARYRLDRPGRARRWLRDARSTWDRGERVGALPRAVGALLLAPEVVFYVAVYPWLRDRSRVLGRPLLESLARADGRPPQTAAHLDRSDAWSDGWVGPRLVVSREGHSGAQAVRIQGTVELTFGGEPLVLTVSVDGREIGGHRIAEAGAFAADLRLGRPLAPGPHRIEIQASAWFVPDRFCRNGDQRPLSWRFGEVEVV